jgi:hypothetical protein
MEHLKFERFNRFEHCASVGSRQIDQNKGCGFSSIDIARAVIAAIDKSAFEKLASSRLMQRQSLI